MSTIKLISILAIPYTFLIAGLWQMGYWSTFDINIFNHLQLEDIVKSFIYPFLTTTAIALVGQLITWIYLSNRINSSTPPKSTNSRSRFIAFELLIYGMVIGATILFVLSDESSRWILLTSTLGTFVGILLNRYDVLEKYITDLALRYNLTHTLIIIPFIAFGYSKFQSENILYRSDSCAIVSIITVKPDVLPFKEYKLLGFAGSYVFLLPKHGKDVIMFQESEIQTLVYFSRGD